MKFLAKTKYLLVSFEEEYFTPTFANKRDMLQPKQYTRPSIKIKTQFLAEVVFGRPSKDCVNFGICRIDHIGTLEENCNCTDKKVQAIVSIFNKYHVELDFLKATISLSSYHQFFGEKRFLVEEDFLQQYENHVLSIIAGNYPIIENDSLIKVIFQN